MSEISRTYTVTGTSKDQPTIIPILAKKNILVQSHGRNTSKVYVALSFDVYGKPTTEWDTLGIYGRHFYSAPKNKKIQYLLAYADQTPQYLEIYASDGSIKIEEQEYIELARETWLLDGSYTERWEQGFRKKLYHGRTGAYFKSDSEANVPFKDWTIPEIVKGDNDIEVYPWNNALRLINSKDGTTLDEIYVGLPKALFRGVMCFEAKLPQSADHTWIGFEVNSGGAYSFIVGLYNDGTYWYLKSLDYIRVVQTDGFNLRFPNQYARYALVYDPPYLELWEAQTTNRSSFPLERTHVLDLQDLPFGKGIPFFANENPNAIVDVRIGEFWIYEMLPRPLSATQNFTNPTSNPTLTLNAGNKSYIEVYAKSIAGGKTVNVYGSVDGTNWRKCDTLTTDATTLDVHKGYSNAYRYIKLELVETGTGTSTLEISASREGVGH